MGKRVLIANVFGYYNRGDAVLVEQLAHYIKESFGENVEISGIASFPEIEREHLNDIIWYERLGKVDGGFLKKVFYHILILISAFAKAFNFTINIRIIPESQRKGLQAIYNSDIIISCAGGFIEDSNISYFSNLLQLFVGILFKKKIIVAPQSIGPIKSRVAKLVLSKVFSKMDVVCVRENISYQFLKNQLKIGKNKILKTTDLAFYYSYRTFNINPILTELNLKEDEDFIACSVVNWSFRNSQYPIEDAQAYKKKYTRLLEKLHEKYKVKILVVNQVSSDLAVTSEIKEELGDYIVIDEKERTPNSIINIIGKSRYFIGSRFHSSIFALLTGTPLIAFSYLPKTDGMMRDLSLDDRVFDIYNFSDAEIFNKIESDFSNYEETKRIISKNLNDLRERNISFDKILSSLP